MKIADLVPWFMDRSLGIDYPMWFSGRYRKRLWETPSRSRERRTANTTTPSSSGRMGGSRTASHLALVLHAADLRGQLGHGVFDVAFAVRAAAFAGRVHDAAAVFNLDFSRSQVVGVGSGLRLISLTLSSTLACCSSNFFSQSS